MPDYDRPLSFLPEDLKRRPFLARQGPVARWITRRLMAYEDRQGRLELLPAYLDWQRALAAGEPRLFASYLERTGIRLEVDDPSGALTETRSGPIVIIANHVYGVPDAIILCAMVERLGFEPRIIGTESGFSSVPEMTPYLLKVDPRQPPKRRDLNEATKAAALAWLQRGGAVAIFPAGRAASPERRGGMAVEYHWKTFAARMIMATRADVLPIFLHGNPGALVNPARQRGMLAESVAMMRLFFRGHRRSYRLSVGALRPFASLGHGDDRHKLTLELREMTFALADGVAAGDVDPGRRPI